MTSDGDTVFVWTWLPGATEPVVAGTVTFRSGSYRFNYGQSYLARPDAMSLYWPELPLQEGLLEPEPGLVMAGALRDGLPDGWGRAVLDARENVPEGSLTEFDYMLKSGSSRFGANDFQASFERYVPRNETATLDELHEAAQRLMDHEPISAALKEALVDGTAIGGARPKAIVTDGEVEHIAKFSASNDLVFPVVNAEGTAMLLAARAGLDVSEVTVTRSLHRDVLLVRRFDRGHGTRRHTVSALTMLKSTESRNPTWSYPALLDVLREYSAAPEAVGPELFRRIAFNMAVSNSDDHPRNLAAFWDGTHLDLTPAFDLAPGNRSGDTATQVMAYGRDGQRRSNFADLVAQAHVYGLSERQGREAIDHIESTIREHWVSAADEARLPDADRDRIFGMQFLNNGLFYGYREPLTGVGWSGPSSE